MQKLFGAMMKIKFYIPRKNAKTSIILISVHWNGKRLQMSTGQSINPQLWDSKKGRVKRNYAITSELNNYLESMDIAIKAKILEQTTNKKETTIDDMKVIIKHIIDPEGEKKTQKLKTSLVYNYEMFIKERKESNLYSDNTIKNYISTLHHLQAFEEYTGKTILFDDVNAEFNEKMLSYLNTQKNLSNNSAANVIKFIKSFMNWALDRAYHSNIKYQRGLKATKKDTQKVVLEIEELDRLENLEDIPFRLQNVRDLFLIQSYTGLRFSDLANLKPENFDLKEGKIKLHMIKTKNQIIIPIHTRLMRILKKYPTLNFPAISNQKYNQYLKELCKIAQIDSEHQIVRVSGKTRKQVCYPKYQLVSSHIARNTFITNALYLGLLPEEVMLLSGHKSRNSFQTYVKITQEKTLKRAANALNKL